jgi:ABC-type dipeptide/oligopeptide/nickel transport system permease component
MRRYWLTRLLRTVAVLFAVSLLAFAIIYAVPGDPVVTLTGMQATQQDLDAVRRSLGLDRPLYVQFARWIGRAVVGDFGTSLFSGRPTFEEILPRLAASLQLTIIGTAVGASAGLALGVFSGARPYSWIDNGSTFIAVLSISVPSFWLGVILIYVFSVILGWFPTSGRGGMEHFVLPGLCVATWSFGLLVRLTRSSVLEVMGEDYVRTARAKGNAEHRIIFWHALKNALLPVVTVLGIQFGLVLTSAVGIEVVFAWPGLGRLIADSILARDYPMVQAAVMSVAVVFILINLVVDLALGYFDPRIRYH